MKALLSFRLAKGDRLVGMEKSLLLKGVIIIILSVFTISSSFSQTNAIDSITTLLKTDKEDTNKVKHLNDLAWELMYQNPDTAILICKQALELATSISFAKGMAQSNNNLGACYYYKGDYALSLSCHFKALEIRKALEDKIGIGSSLGNIGLVYTDYGDYAKALEFDFKALKLNEEIGNKTGICTNLGNIGIVYQYQLNYVKALEYDFKALKLHKELENKNGIANNLNNIGNVYVMQGNDAKALEYYFKALTLNEKLENKKGITKNLGNIGLVYKHQNDYTKALEYYFKALKLSEELGNKSSIGTNLGNIGALFIKQKRYKEAEDYLQKALLSDTEIGNLEGIKESNGDLSELYAQTNRYQLAYKHYKLYTAAKDSLFNEEKSKEIGRLEMRHEIEIAEIERERKAAEELKIKIQKTERRNLLEYSSIVILLLVIGLLITVLGFAKVKPWMAEGITFFAFLLFFEFMLVLLDPFMDKFTKGEPAYKLLINAAVAMCIFPIHAFFEKKLKKRLMKK